MNVSNLHVRELIEGLRRHHGTDDKLATWRELERIYGIKYQTLQNWCEGSKEHAQLFDFIEKARNVLNLTEGTAYRRSVKTLAK